MQREFDVCITATTATAIAGSIPAPNQAAAQNVRNDDEVLDEVPKEVQNLIFCFAGLPQKEIVKIFHNLSKPTNLYCFCHMWSHYYKSLYNQKRINIEDGMLRLKKTSEIFKDFGKLFYKVWLKSFHNNITIMISLFILNTVELNVALNTFYSNILQFS